MSAPQTPDAPTRDFEAGQIRILVAIANHGTRNLHHLQRLLDVYRSYSHLVDVVVLSNVPKDVGDDVEVRVGLPTRDPWSLPFGHRQLFAERAEDYHYFIYSEDDTELPQKSFEAYRRASALLPAERIAGFLRYEVADDGTVYCCTAHGPYHWDPQSVFCAGDHVFARYTNDHGACFVLSRAQLKACIASGAFLVPPHRGRYDMLCSAATDPYTQCGFEKVIPISHFDAFCLRHLSDRYQGTIGVEMVEIERQVDRLLAISRGRPPSAPWLANRTALPVPEFDKKFFEPENAAVLAALPGTALRILSVGCTRGVTEHSLMTRGHLVTAVPVDPVIAESARLRGVEVLEADPERAAASLGDRRFDAIVFNGVLNYVADPVALLQRFRPRLVPGGKLVVGFTNFAHPALFLRRLRGDRTARLLASRWPFERVGIHPASGRHVAAWLRAAGLVPGATRYTMTRRDRQLRRLTLGLMDGRLGRHGAMVATDRESGVDRQQVATRTAEAACRSEAPHFAISRRERTDRDGATPWPWS